MSLRGSSFLLALLVAPLLACTALIRPAGAPTPAPTAAPEGSGAFPIWIVSGMERVGQADPPGAETRAELFAARGEYEPFQIVVRAPEGGLTGVTLSVSDLTGADGQSISAANLALYREHYIYVGQSSPAEPEDVNQPLGVGWYPDALIPFVDPATGRPPDGELRAAPFDLDGGQNQPIWVDVFVLRDAPPGVYTGAYTVTSDQGAASGEIQLTVWDFELPLKPSLLSAFIFQNGPSRAGNLELLRHRVMPAEVAPEDEREFVDTYGLTTADLGFFSGAIYGYCEMTPAPSADEIRAAAARHQPDVRLYNFTADEIDECPQLFDPLKKWARNLHAAGIPNLVTVTPRPELYDDGMGRSVVDIWVLHPLMYDDAPDRAAEVLSLGHEVWSYTALVQDGYSPKWEIDFAPINYRIFHGFINQSLGLTGILYWAVDWWTEDPWNDPISWTADGEYFPGEGVLVYPGEAVGIEGVVPSMRLKWIREGVEDYEYIALLKERGQGEWALEIARTVGADWSHWTQDPQALEAARRQLGEALAQTVPATEPVLRPTSPPAERLARLARGVNLPSRFWFGPDDPAEIAPRFADEELELLRGLGFTYVRLPVDLYLLLDRDHPERLEAEMLFHLNAALDTILAHDLAVVVDLHNFVPDEEGLDFGARLEQDDEFVEALAQFWRAFAAELSRRDPNMVFLEAMNEPVFVDDPARWQEIQPRLLAAMREGAPEHTLIAAGTAWAGLYGLLDLEPVDDPNVVYNFHYYEPFPFTHQGADWAGEAVEPLRNVPYPSSPENVAPLLASLADEEIRGYLRDYGEQRWDAAKIEAEIALAAAWAGRYGVPVICNEFGVFRTYAPPEDRARWIRDVRQALEKYGIGWAMWEYDDEFGLVYRAAGEVRLDAPVAEALGLITPGEQR